MIGLLAEYFGWDAVFAFLIGCCFIPGLLLITKLKTECKEYNSNNDNTYEKLGPGGIN